MKHGAMNVLIGGEAGQGLVTIGQILAKVLVRSGFHIVVNQDYMSRIRGGHNTFSIRFAENKIEATQDPVDVLIALNEETAETHKSALRSGGIVIGDEKYSANSPGVVAVPLEKLGETKYSNVVYLGVVCSIFGIDFESVAEVVHEILGAKHAEAAQKNRDALKNSYEWAKSLEVPTEKLTPPKSFERRIVAEGNEAIAIGAMAAGLKFYSYYPMSPATSIALAIAERAEKVGVIIEQAEDEIAAINMAIGASFAGVPSMVGTSGGGFALMVEGVSLAAMTETPITIVVSQRPAPATGLPTRTEQADLDFVLHSGHGEFARAIFAPGSVEECFSLTQKAMKIAHKYQIPAFVLTDQFLSDSYRDVAPFDIDGSDPIETDTTSYPADYKRYAITDNGVSPRAIPGTSDALVVADSDEHTEDGHLTEDLEVRQLMMDKRLRKAKEIIDEVMPPEFIGTESPELLLVTWGSTKGAVLEAAKSIGETNVRTSVLFFPQLWPLVPENFLNNLEKAKTVVCVEGNAFGQFARLIRRETGFHIPEFVRRYDGLPITPKYILDALKPILARVGGLLP